MSKDVEIYVSLKVKDFPDNPMPRVKKLCTGGCGDMVWVDKNTEFKWSKIPILCLECALEEIGSNDPEDGIEIVVLPESLESLMAFHIKNRGRIDELSKNR